MTTSGPSDPPRPSLGERPRTHPEINEYRRRALIEGAIQSLAEHGVAGTTVRTICAAAGSSRGLISHYYDSKEELLAAAFRHLFDSMSESVGEAIACSGPAAADRLKAVPRTIFSPALCTEVSRNAFLSFWHEVRFNEAVRRTNRELYRGYIGRAEALFRAAAEEQGAGIEPRRAALGLIGLIDGLWLGMSIQDGAISRRQAIDICLAYIDRELAS